MNDLPVLQQSAVAGVAALIDERIPHDELDRAWSVLLRLWDAVDHLTALAAPADGTGTA
jgi:hypothetical protein